MNSNYLLVDENTSLHIRPDYDPLLQDTFEEYIHLTEKVNLGRRFFNNIDAKETREVQVSGLVLYFGADLSKSVLRSIVYQDKKGGKQRNNIERLNLYADTIIIDAPLHFPQANISIYARRLIFGKNGQIDTTPEAFVNPIPTDGAQPEKRKPIYRTLDGHSGSKAGDISLFVDQCTFPKDQICFVQNGSNGQDGENGGHQSLLKPDPQKVPVTWNTILNTVLDFDFIRGGEGNWNWPHALKNFAQNGSIYFIRLNLYNNSKSPNYKQVELGAATIDGKIIPNQDNGLDAYPSGAGGRGGDAGKLFYINTPITAKNVSQKKGAGGKSASIKGTKRKSTYSKLCLFDVKVAHKGTPEEVPYQISNVGYLKCRDGKNAPGTPGDSGQDGQIKMLARQSAKWLHPLVVGNILQYTRDTWLKGDRKPAKHLLPLYQKAFETLLHQQPNLLADPILLNQRNTIDLSLKKIEVNLDYFGNPLGWIPRLSTASNIDILQKSSPTIIQLLHYANSLNWENTTSQDREDRLSFLAQQLNDQITKARNALVEAYGHLDGVKVDLIEIQNQTDQYLSKIQDLEQEVVNELKKEEQEQALFTGACQLAAGLCHVIPVGQPYVGEIGDSLLTNISKIDIHSDNPFGEAVKTSMGVAKDLGSFVTKNKEQITKNLTSTLNTNIDSANGTISKVDKDIDQHKKNLATCKEELQKRFGDKLSLLQGMIKGMSAAKSMEEAEFYAGDDYAEIILHTDYLRSEVKDMEDLSSAEMEEMKKALSELGEEKKELISQLKGYESKKKKRAEGIGKTGKYLEEVGKGIRGVGAGLQTMMTPISEESEAFRKKVASAKNGKFKKKFKSLFEKIDKLNAHKYKTAQKLLKLEGTISASAQRISDNLVKVAAFNDQRAEEIERQLNPMTKLFLDDVLKDTWELLRAEMYYLVKSFQYRFVRKVNPNFYNVQLLIEDINKFYSKNNIEHPSEEDLEKAFKTVIQGLFVKLVLELLTNRVNNLPQPTKGSYAISLDENAVTQSGMSILGELNDGGKSNFYFHEMGTHSVGSGEEFYYRIIDIKFTGIEVEFDEVTLRENPGIDQHISFKLGLSHSGDSIIRSEDGQYYFFTTRSPETDQRVIKNVASWRAVYNAAKRSDSDNGLNNEEVSTTDTKILQKLLAGLAIAQEDQSKDNSLSYTSHLPGATSLMTLAIDKNNIGVDFKITKLSFDFHWEQIYTDLQAKQSDRDREALQWA